MGYDASPETYRSNKACGVVSKYVGPHSSHKREIYFFIILRENLFIESIFISNRALSFCLCPSNGEFSMSQSKMSLYSVHIYNKSGVLAVVIARIPIKVEQSLSHALGENFLKHFR